MDYLFHANATCESPIHASQFFVEGHSGVRSCVLFTGLSLCEKATSDFKITFQVVTYQCEVLPLQNKSLVAGFLGGGVGGVGGGSGWTITYKSRFFQDYQITQYMVLYAIVKDCQCPCQSNCILTAA